MESERMKNMKVVDNIAGLIGNTPLVKLHTLPQSNGANVYVKLEYFNPSRSVKDRAAYNMIIDAEKRSEEHTSELQSRFDLVCRLLLEKKKKQQYKHTR